MNWMVVKYENNILTTRREGNRYEDFFFRDDGLIDAFKHYGDHEYESGSEVTPQKYNGEYDLTGDQCADLVNAAILFHRKSSFSKEDRVLLP